MKRTSKKDFSIVFSLLFCFLLFYVFLLLHSQKAASSSQSRFPYSVYDSGRDGCKALYLLLKKLYFPSDVLEGIPNMSRQRKGAFVFIGGSMPYFGDEDEIKKWVREGNVFVAFSEYPRWRGEIRTKDVKAKSNLRRYSSFSFLTRSGENNLFKNCSSRMALRGGRWMPLLADADGALAASRKEGKGKIVFVSCADFLTNAEIQNEGNAFFAANFFKQVVPDGGKIYFDEESHGLASRASLFELLKHSPSGWALFCLASALLIYFYYKSRRFGTPLSSRASETVRESSEFVDAFASLYRSARAYPYVFLEIKKDFIKKASAALLLLPDAPEDRLLSCAENKGINSLLRFKNVLQLKESDVHSEEKLFHVVCEMDQILKELKLERNISWKK